MLFRNLRYEDELAERPHRHTGLEARRRLAVEPSPVPILVVGAEKLGHPTEAVFPLHRLAAVARHNSGMTTCAILCPTDDFLAD